MFTLNSSVAPAQSKVFHNNELVVLVTITVNKNLLSPEKVV